jgi:transposase
MKDTPENTNSTEVIKQLQAALKLRDQTISEHEKVINENKKVISEHEKVIVQREKTIQKLDKTILKQEATIAKLKDLLYGRKSEKRPTPSTSSEPEPEIIETPTTPVTETTKRRRAFLDSDPLPEKEHEVPCGILPAHLERKDIHIDTRPDDWSEETYVALPPKITERLVCVPAKFYVQRYTRAVWQHRDTKEFAPLPPVPEHLFGRCAVDISVIVHSVINRYCYHLPYYRQEKMFASFGVGISRDSLIRWGNNLGLLFSPVVNALEEVIKQSSVIHIDETFFVGKPSKGSAYKQMFIWPMLAPEVGVVFRWTEKRNNQTAEEVMKGIKAGTSVVSDGLSHYHHCAQKYEFVQQLCWAHVRRKFYEALASNQALATLALDKLAAIFHQEACALKGKPKPKEILSYRQEKVRPLVEAFIVWVKEIKVLPEVVTSSSLSTACTYLLKRENEAQHFLSNPYVLMHNNDDEREAKNIKLGAKNWLFTSSEDGANAMCVFYSLIRSAEMVGIHPFYYLLDIAGRLETPGIRAVDLIPTNWKARYYQEAVPAQYRTTSQEVPQSED